MLGSLGRLSSLSSRCNLLVMREERHALTFDASERGVEWRLERRSGSQLRLARVLDACRASEQPTYVYNCTYMYQVNSLTRVFLNQNSTGGVHTMCSQL